ncbi:LIMR family protein [Sesamum angolense]|uniref:LIMR family protein n=1 Tax=Sesamum angolense TaxID=2727404 RepID=A0AAE2BNV3_9LAMI|nr:LIMR family protein [Sesamum angolense]
MFISGAFSSSSGIGLIRQLSLILNRSEPRPCGLSDSSCRLLPLACSKLSTGMPRPQLFIPTPPRQTVTGANLPPLPHAFAKPDLQETELDSNQSKARRKHALIRIVRGVLIFNPTRNGGFQFSPVIVAIIVCVLVFIFNVYLLVNYQHPDDANQAYFPKFVVVLGLSIAAISILMLPADVANRQACRHAIYNGACSLTLPMKDLWLAIYIMDAVLVFFVIPFTMFYYEGDQDKSVGKRLKSALIWVILTAVVCALLLGILYGCFDNICNSKMLMREIDFTAKHGEIAFCCTGFYILACGEVDFTVRHLSSSTTNFPSSWDFSNSQQCIGNGAKQCSAYSANASSETTWTMRSTFPEYVVALATIVGSVLFTIFGGVGIACLPLDSYFHLFGVQRLLSHARSISRRYFFWKKMSRPWKRCILKAEAAWAMTVLGYLAKLVLGVLGLMGTVAFAFFCFYLLLAVIAGATMLGLKVVFITIHPMKWGATLMNSFLFNVGLILLCSISVIQFCATAFAYYAQATAAQEIFGHTLQSLRGIKYLYKGGEEKSLVAGSSFPHKDAASEYLRLNLLGFLVYHLLSDVNSWMHVARFCLLCCLEKTSIIQEPMKLRQWNFHDHWVSIAAPAFAAFSCF